MFALEGKRRWLLDGFAGALVLMGQRMGGVHRRIFLDEAYRFPSWYLGICYVKLRLLKTVGVVSSRM